MQYFDSLPKTLKTKDGISIIMTDLLARASIIPELLKNPLLYYDYDIQEGDTPEIIAHKYYSDPYRYWIILFANQLLDPQWDWPMDSTLFESYLANKYPDFNPNSQIYNYEKIITQYDFATQKITEKTIVIDENTYTSLITGTNTYTLPTGRVSVTVNKAAVSYYDYEYKLNESKRKINILNSIYVNELENQFKTLMV